MSSKKRLYVSVFNEIAGLIDSGEFPVGHRLPTERELSERFQVSRPTIREAIIALEAERKSAPHDPGVLINLGIAYAHQGDDAKALDLFKAAMTSPDPIELETADGNLTDSRRLARKAMRMLERGEFRPVSERLTYRE